MNMLLTGRETFTPLPIPPPILPHPATQGPGPADQEPNTVGFTFKKPKGNTTQTQK